MSQSPSKKIASMWGNAMNKLGSIVSGDGDRREEEENHLPELDENLAIALRLVCERIRTQGANTREVFLRKGSSRSVKDLEYACLSFSGLENSVSLQKLQINIR